MSISLQTQENVMRDADGMIIQQVLTHLALFDDFENWIKKM